MGFVEKCLQECRDDMDNCLSLVGRATIYSHKHDFFFNMMGS